MKTRQRLISPKLFALCLASFAGSSVHAATITFYAPTTISDTSALDAPYTLSLSGFTVNTFVQAGNFPGTGNGGAQTVNTVGGHTVNFAGIVPTTAGPSGTATGLFYAGPENNNALFNGDTGSAGFNNVLRSQGFASGIALGNHTTLRLGGLTAGQTYVVQLLTSDTRGGSAQRTEYFTDTLGGGGSDSSTFFVGQPSYVLGSFQADGTGYQDVFVYPGLGSNAPNDTTLSGFTLYSASAVPEPSVVGLGAFGILCLAIRQRYARR